MVRHIGRLTRPARQAGRPLQRPLPPAVLETLERRTLLAFTVGAAVETDPVPHSGDAADDAAVWVHPADASQSTVIGSDKDGGLAVYDLSGNELQYVSIGSVNNVDLRHGFPLGGEAVDLVVGSNRSSDVLVVYKVNPATRLLEGVAARPLESGLGDVYGLALYHSPTTGAVYAFASDRNDGRVEQWELFDDGTGRVDGRIVRTFDAGGTVEGMVADDETGALYAGEERGGLWRYGAEPADGTTRTLVDTTGDGGRLTAELEGLAIYYAAGGAGYLLASSQGSNEFVIYDRLTGAFVDRFRVVSGTIDGVGDTDGIDVSSFGLGPLFPEGLFVAQDGSNGGGNQNFKLVSWGDIARAASPALVIDATQDPRARGQVATRPAAPTGLSATAVSATRVDLAGADNSDNEYGFRVERSTDGTSWARLATVGRATYTDASAPAGSTLHYRVLAVNAAGDSDPSNVATAVTPWAVPTSAVTFVPAGSVWAYLHDGSDPGAGWSAPGFDDAAWARGPAQLGYGDGDEATVIGPGVAPSFITSYFRHAFDVADPAAVTGLTLDLLRDDGAVVYLNGAEVVRSNMPAGAVTHTTGSSASVGPAAEGVWHRFELDPAALVAGRNVLAVEVHQASSASADLSFDLKLAGAQVAAPTAPAAPTPLAPSTAVGTAQTFSVVYSDPNGWENLSHVFFRVNSDLPYMLDAILHVPGSRLYLRDTTTGALLGGFLPGSGNVISNANGTLNCADLTVTKSGNDLTVTGT